MLLKIVQSMQIALGCSTIRERTDLIKWFHCDKNDNKNNFIRMETRNESGNGEVSSRVEAFATFEDAL